MRGEDKHNNFKPVPAPCALFSADSLALYQHIRDAQAKVMMKGANTKTGLYG